MHSLARCLPGVLLPLTLIPSLAFGAQAGPYNSLRPDEAAVSRGRSLYAQGCINCHGLDVKGTENGPDLIRLTNGPITYELDRIQYLVVGAGDSLYAFVMLAE